MTVKLRSNPIGCSHEEWEVRVDLAACYRIAARNRMGKVVWNHITARVPGEDGLLINRLGYRWDEITASNLMKIDAQGRPVDGDPAELNFSGYVIHGAVHEARPDILCSMHTHTRGGQVVGALKCGLLPLCQEAMLFYEDIAYHAYEGIADDVNEQERLAANLGNCNQMILRNHGLLTVGATVGEAYWRMFQLEWACALQADVLATGQEFEIPSPEICRKARLQYIEEKAGYHEWPALRRELDQTDPAYAT